MRHPNRALFPARISLTSLLVSFLLLVRNSRAVADWAATVPRFRYACFVFHVVIGCFLRGLQWGSVVLDTILLC